MIVSFIAFHWYGRLIKVSRILIYFSALINSCTCAADSSPSHRFITSLFCGLIRRQLGAPIIAYRCWKSFTIAERSARLSETAGIFFIAATKVGVVSRRCSTSWQEIHKGACTKTKRGRLCAAASFFALSRLCIQAIAFVECEERTYSFMPKAMITTLALRSSTLKTS